MSVNRYLVLNILFLLFGVLIASEAIGFVDPFMEYYGLGMLFWGIISLTSYAYLYKFENVITSAIVTACVTTVVFCIFAMFGAIPNLPLGDRYSYMLIAIPFLCVGGGTCAVDFIRINGMDVTVTTKYGLFGKIKEIVFKK